MKNRYITIYKYGEDEIEINKSRFIGYAKPVKSEEEALKFIEKINTKHYDATHNCYAYIIGKDSMVQRFNDDGEPSGTAGIPMLELLKKENIVDTVVVATRYFGGVKLGAGGLIRAYTKTAKIGVEAGLIVEMILHKIIRVRIDYTLYGQVENFLLNKKYIIKNSNFDDAVNLEIYVPYYNKDSLGKTLVDITNGTAEISEIGEEYLPFKDKKLVK